MTVKAHIIYNLPVDALSQDSIKKVNNTFYYLVILSLDFPGGSSR